MHVDCTYVLGHVIFSGGHPFPFSGIFDIRPRDARELGEQFKFKQSFHMGNTDFTDREVARITEELGKVIQYSLVVTVRKEYLFI